MISTIIKTKCPSCHKQIAKNICLDGEPDMWSVGTIIICEVLENGSDVGCGSVLAINIRFSLEFKTTLIQSDGEVQERLL